MVSAQTETKRPQPFRAGDAVDVRVGGTEAKPITETWVIACYEADRDVAWIAGWPCSMVSKASEVLKLHRAATDIQHAQMVRDVLTMRGDFGDGDPRRTAMERVRSIGGVP